MELFQIWVNSVHAASGYFTVYGNEPVNRDHFDVHLATGDTRTSYCRTGYLGFVRRTDMTQSDGGQFASFCLVDIIPKHKRFRSRGIK